MKNILITGGAGFIGSHVVRRFINDYPDYHIYNLDALTYAGNLENIKDIDSSENYTFIRGNITDKEFINDLFNEVKFDGVIHLAAESHVDRSISSPMDFIETNIIGTVHLLNAARVSWLDNLEGKVFYHVSTDEVYGSLGEEGFFVENTSYDPRSPYSASKASSDHLVRAYHHTYNLPVKISNCSNNYGPHQFPEKLIPLMIHNIKHNKPLPIYGKGDNVRDWLWVNDHARAIDVIYHKGAVGETYNIGGDNEWTNLALVHLLCDSMDKKLGRNLGKSKELITFVTDRKGHDQRYAIDASKLKTDLGWTPSLDFEEGLNRTIDWYLNNDDWLENVTSGEYQVYFSKQYLSK
tara:strand:+ start:473 stop:1525 length:1053 start_codon:yes stop_codon:yes gene_type:complete